MSFIKKLTVTLLTLLFLVSPLVAQDEETTAAPAADEKIGVDVGIAYSSEYFWKGMGFYGRNRGVYFPWIGYGGIDNMYFYVGGELGQELIGENTSNNTERDWRGVDFIASYYLGLGDAADMSINLKYFYYPVSRDNDVFNDFANADIGFTFKNLPVTPHVNIGYYYYVDSDYADDTAQNWYVNVGVDKTYQLVDGASLTTGLETEMFNYKSAYPDDSLKWTHIKYFTKLSVSAGATSFYGGWNIAYIPDEDLQGTDEVNMWHQWAEFGATYSM